MRGTAFLVVGHKSWGKSRTLRALTSDRLTRTAMIRGHELVVRRMSNDDKPAEFDRFVRGCRPTREPRIVLPFCPRLVHPDGDARAAIAAVHRRYDIFIWVQLNSYDGSRTICAHELDALARFGTLFVFRKKRAGAEERASSLRRFILRNLD